MKLSLIPHLSQRLPYHQNCATENSPPQTPSMWKKFVCANGRLPWVPRKPRKCAGIGITQVTKRTNISDIYIVAEKKGLSVIHQKLSHLNTVQVIFVLS